MINEWMSGEMFQEIGFELFKKLYRINTFTKHITSASKTKQ